MEQELVWKIFISYLLVNVKNVVADEQGNVTYIDEQGDTPTMFGDQPMRDKHPQSGCIDWKGMRVEDGHPYLPRSSDLCLQCTCNMTQPVMCHSVACSPPHDCARPYALDDTCCKFICLDDDNILKNGSRPGDDHGEDDSESITNLSLRLIASTVTSFLVLALLLFMVHRLRQRRLLMAMRRFEAHAQQVHSEDTDSEQYIPEMYMSIECPPYTEPPPPYSPPKPPQILPGEQPPPYEESNQRNFLCHSNDQVSCSVNGISSTSEQLPVQSGENCDTIQLEQPEAYMEISSPGLEDGTTTGHMFPSYTSTNIELGPAQQNPTADRMFQRNSLQSRTHMRRPRGQNESSGNARGHRSRHDRFTAQTLPAPTTFQRFSNLFKRDNVKVRKDNRSSNLPQEDRIDGSQSSNNPVQYSSLHGFECGASSSQGFFGGRITTGYRFYPATSSPSSTSSDSSGIGENYSRDTSVHQETSFSNHQDRHIQDRSCVRDSRAQCPLSSPSQPQEYLQLRLPPLYCPNSEPYTQSNNRACSTGVRTSRPSQHGDDKDCSLVARPTITSLPTHYMSSSDPQRSLATLMCSNLPVVSAAQSVREQAAYTGCEVYSDDNTRTLQSENQVCNNDPSVDSRNSRTSRFSEGPNRQPYLGVNDTFDNQSPHQEFDSPQEVSSNLNTSAIYAIRRSHSDTSQDSQFSVCSETGEQKLKATRNMEVDSSHFADHRILSADSHYPQEHHPAPSTLRLDPDKHDSLSKKSKHHVQSSKDSLSTVKPLQSSRAGSLTAVENYKPIPGKLAIMNQHADDDETANANKIGSKYNFNKSPYTHKRLGSKDLLPMVGENEQAKHENSQCEMPFVTLQSGSLLTHASTDKSPSFGQANYQRRLSEECPDSFKKRKKRLHSRNSSNLSSFYVAEHKPQNDMYSDTHEQAILSKTMYNDPNKGGLCRVVKNNHRGKVLYKDSYPPSHDSIQMSSFSSDSAAQCDIVDDQKNAAGYLTSQDYELNDLNQPCRKWQDSLNREPVLRLESTDQGESFHSDHPEKKSIQKPNHRPQGSFDIDVRGNGYGLSPTKRKSHPKYGEGSEARIYDKRHSTPAVRSVYLGAEIGEARRGARSGFGQDMSLDDESGLADLHILQASKAVKNVDQMLSNNMTVPFQNSPVLSKPEQLEGHKPSDRGTPMRVDIGNQRGLGCSNNFRMAYGTKSGASSNLAFVGKESADSGSNCNRRRASDSHCASRTFKGGVIACNDQVESQQNHMVRDLKRRLFSEEVATQATSYV